MMLPLEPPITSMPLRLPTAAVPAASVPMELLWTRLPVVPAPVIRTPALSLPEMTLRAPGTLPPTVLLSVPPKIETPWLPLPTSRAPVTSKPI